MNYYRAQALVLMNYELPIADFRKQILKTIKENSVTIVVAETGAGKSTQVPQYLLQQGCEVLVTQPRRLAARTVAERVAQEWGSRFGGMVGFQTAFEQRKCKTTRCLFATDGLALVYELLGKRKPGTVLVIDEVHEWNSNIETLIAYVKKRLPEDKDLKVVLMSATLEADKLSKYFNDAPIINVPGRSHEICDVVPSNDMVGDIVRMLEMKLNTLVFVAGKRDISKLSQEIEERLKTKEVKAKILPLHGESSPDAQKACFESYIVPKCIIATNVAQTSITIPDIRAVVDTGMEMRNEIQDGSDGLLKKPISFADSEQRRGRTGRCGKGLYVDYCPKNDASRLAFPKAEILRCLLDNTVLRLAAVGLDAGDLTFFHQPNPKAITDAKKSLKLIGCLDQNDRITEIGKAVNALHVSAKYGRMVVEAEKLGVLDDVITIAAILETQGITERKGPWRRKLCAGENESDLLAQLAAFKLCEGKDREWMKENGVFIKSYFKVKETRRHLAKQFDESKLKSSGDRESIIRAICVGLVEHIFLNFEGRYVGATGRTRKLTNFSVVSGVESWIVGLPFDIDMEGDGNVFAIVSMATAVDLAFLEETVPQAFRYVKGQRAHYNYKSGKVVSTTTLFFGNYQIGSKVVEDPNHPKAAEIIAEERKACEKEITPQYSKPRKPSPVTPSPDALVRLKHTKVPLKDFGDL